MMVQARSLGRAPMAHVLQMAARQTMAQALIFWRMPAVSATALLMPLMLFVLFVLPHAREVRGSVTVGAYMLASIAAYGVGSVMVFNFGVTVALDRAQKVDLLMRTTPLPTWIALFARVVSALAFGIVVIVALFALAIVFGEIRLAPRAWLEMAAALVLGALPFIGFGLAVGYLGGPSAAPAIANLVYIGLAFGGGLLVPLDQMPPFLAAVAPYLPTYHHAQIAWSAIGASDEGALVSGAWLIGYAVVLFALAGWAYRREANRKFS